MNPFFKFLVYETATLLSAVCKFTEPNTGWPYELLSVLMMIFTAWLLEHIG